MILSVLLNTKSLESSLKMSSTPDPSCISQASFWPLSWPKLPRISLGILSCGLTQLPRVWNLYSRSQRRTKKIVAYAGSALQQNWQVVHSNTQTVRGCVGSKWYHCTRKSHKCNYHIPNCKTAHGPNTDSQDNVILDASAKARRLHVHGNLSFIRSWNCL